MKNFFKYVYVDFGFKIIGKFLMIPNLLKEIPPPLHNF